MSWLWLAQKPVREETKTNQQPSPLRRVPATTASCERAIVRFLLLRTTRLQPPLLYLSIRFYTLIGRKNQRSATGKSRQPQTVAARRLPRRLLTRKWMRSPGAPSCHGQHRDLGYVVDEPCRRVVVHATCCPLWPRIAATAPSSPVSPEGRGQYRSGGCERAGRRRRE